MLLRRINNYLALAPVCLFARAIAVCMFVLIVPSLQDILLFPSRQTFADSVGHTRKQPVTPFVFFTVMELIKWNSILTNINYQPIPP